MTDRKTIFSPDRRYRYTLWREWPGADLFNQSIIGYVMFVGLNPSTADEMVDDPTIRKCVGFAKRWGFCALCMTNLFAFRATEPRKMEAEKFPIGSENDKWLVDCARGASAIVAAWGTRGAFMGRDEEVRKLLHGMKCLRRTQHGFPEHPLYIPYDTPLTDFEP